jgi:ABC-2 type transport system ATP-binding protein
VPAPEAVRGGPRFHGRMTTTPISRYAVETAGLTKRFGERLAVDDVDLCVPRGVAFGYLGPNGAGKTTLIRMLLGLTPASAGSMQLLGLPVPDRRAHALARVGAIVEEPRFYGHLTGRENLQLITAARANGSVARIDRVLERVGLAARADERVKAYSLGMKQRLGIARCLLADPELLILDEPMNGLDPAGIQEFRAFVRDFVAEGRTIVLSSHLLDEVEKTCDHVAIVDRGRIVVQGSIDDLRAGGDAGVLLEVDEPARARAFLAAMPDVTQVDDDGTLLEVSCSDFDLIPELNRRLVAAGIAVRRLEPRQASLEQRFLEITTRLEDAA